MAISGSFLAAGFEAGFVSFSCLFAEELSLSVLLFLFSLEDALFVLLSFSVASDGSDGSA